jgi:hypothetical protein
MVDPRVTWEDLSAMVLGCQTYLKAKAVGESSMSGKPGCSEAAKRYARRSPDGKVKAGLPEPQCPNCRSSGREGRMEPGRLLEPRLGSDLGKTDRLSLCRSEALRGGWVAYSDLKKDTKGAPKPS